MALMAAQLRGLTRCSSLHISLAVANKLQATLHNYKQAYDASQNTRIEVTTCFISCQHSAADFMFMNMHEMLIAANTAAWAWQEVCLPKLLAPV